jgi:hypothetical protein
MNHADPSGMHRLAPAVLIAASVTTAMIGIRGFWPVARQTCACQRVSLLAFTGFASLIGMCRSDFLGRRLQQVDH